MLMLTLFEVNIVSSFSEVLVPRAFLQDLRFSGKNGKVMALICSSFNFGLTHYNCGLMSRVPIELIYQLQRFCETLISIKSTQTL